jgi:hypothetical protein
MQRFLLSECQICKLCLMRVFWFLCFFVIAACNKTKHNQVPTHPLIGSWHPNSAPIGRAIIFETNGDLIYQENGSLLSYPYNSFRIDNDSTVTFVGLNTKRVIYRFEGPELILEGACLDTCSERFNKILPL